MVHIYVTWLIYANLVVMTSQSFLQPKAKPNLPEGTLGYLRPKPNYFALLVSRHLEMTSQGVLQCGLVQGSKSRRLQLPWLQGLCFDLRGMRLVKRRRFGKSFVVCVFGRPFVGCCCLQVGFRCRHFLGIPHLEKRGLY